MIIDTIVAGFVSMLVGIIENLPAEAAGPPLPGAGTELADGFAQVLGTMMLLDQGLPVHETIAAVGALIAVTLVINAYIVIRAVARWMPSWITGGG